MNFVQGTVNYLGVFLFLAEDEDFKPDAMEEDVKEE